jgi:hypothetical protein
LVWERNAPAKDFVCASIRAASALTSAAASFISAMQARTIARISFISRVRRPCVTRLRLP